MLSWCSAGNDKKVPSSTMAVCCSNDTDKKPEKTPMDPEEFYHVMVIGARGLRNTDWMPGLGKPDCYCEVRAVGHGASSEPLFVTKVLDNTLQPIWREEASLPAYKKKQALQFKIFDKDLTGSDYLGKVELEAGYFNKVGFNGELPLEEAGTGIKAYLNFKIKPPNGEYPPPPKREFDVEVERRDKDCEWGLTLAKEDESHLFIAEVSEGAFDKYNSTQDNEDLKVMSTDFVTAVDGQKTNLLDNLKQATKATVTIVRAEAVAMVLEKKTASITAEFGRKDVSEGGLVIKKLGDCMFKEYNDTQNDPDIQVKEGDRIVSINGIYGNSLELERMLQNIEGKFQVGVVRCATDAASGNRWGFFD
mmetsp:Transcript_63707/g.126036  ORF Transcript_63707/g.126036 Transcript_63707/m.126036 type:complete len:362 (+) Transcript_63707:93-1178(+)